MTKAGRVFLDSNVLIYAFDAGNPVKRATAMRLLEDEAERIVLSAQVLGEFHVNVSRKLQQPLPAEEAAAATAQFSRLPIVPVDAELVRSAISISGEAQLSYWDGLIVAAASAAGCDCLLTEDLNAGQVIAGVEVVNPFAAPVTEA